MILRAREGWLFGLNSYSLGNVDDVMYSPYFGDAAQRFWNDVKNR